MVIYGHSHGFHKKVPDRDIGISLRRGCTQRAVQRTFPRCRDSLGRA